MLRILVADDSATARGLVVEILSSDPAIQVVGEAKDGAEAVRMTAKLRPNLVTMDSHMPRMDGFEATKEIMIATPTPIVILTASEASGDIQAAMQALRVGALTVLQKPSGPNVPGFEETARQMVATLKAMAQVKVVRHHRSITVERRTASAVARGVTTRGRIVAITASTGGPAALQRVLSGLPEDFHTPILVVQHISHGFTRGFAAWLQTVCPFQVRIPEDAESLAGRTVYLAPEDRHLGVADSTTLRLSSEPPIGGFRPSGTFLFRSVARVFGASTVALILTGMGQDGVEGLHAVREAGGQIIAQDEQSSVVFGMPGAAVAAGLPHSVLPVEAIAERLVEVV